MSEIPTPKSRLRISPHTSRVAGGAAITAESSAPGPNTSRLTGKGLLIAKETASDAPLKAKEKERHTKVIEGLTVELAADSKVIYLKSGGKGVTNAVLPGFWHLSTSKMDAFTNDKDTDRGSNLGPSTYVGHGALTGTQLRILRKDTHVKYDLSLRGNILLVPMDQDNVSLEVAGRVLGDSLGGVAHMPPGNRANKVLQGHGLDDVPFDGFVFVHAVDPSDPTGERVAEGVIFNPEEAIQVVGQTIVVSRSDPLA